MKEELDKILESDAAVKADFEAKEIKTVDFAKKTLGQMAFLYFLQKKGWFGVAPEALGNRRKTFCGSFSAAAKSMDQTFR